MTSCLCPVLRTPIDHPFATGVVVYAGIVLAIWYFGWPAQSGASDYVAARVLVHNHRLVVDDLQRPAGLGASFGFYMARRDSLAGRYVTASPAIQRGEQIKPALLAEHADMLLPDTMRAVVFPLAPDAHLIGLLDAGSPVVLLGQDPDTKAAVTIAATVQAIACETAAGDAKTCNPILRIPASQSQFVTRNLAALRLALRSDP